MRVYVLCSGLIESIIIKATLVEKKVIKKIYSNEGIFYVNNNTLYKLDTVIDELPAEEVNIKDYKLIIEKNKVIYEPECFQLPPEHISETIMQYIYSLPENDTMIFIIEKHVDEAHDEAYFSDEIRDKYIIEYITDMFL